MKRRNPAHTKRLLARNLRQHRLQKSWSQYDLADASRLRQALISGLEAGTANPTLQSLDRIAIALGLELAELMTPPGKVLVDMPKREPEVPAQERLGKKKRRGLASSDRQ
ncbi:helix-turn-helix transcriptional regulator [Bradyrhizobium huanghuaihaiense]|uniref:helix-turn-helix domain-containing protein n=1 Tax=Bradyrhizobium huanghuaihaiense TaxID=990078 RepID=UPI0021A98459|nr:helix-turn-helix transcriptional regulator [Bradyrhizobium sp. CB3035]UWU76601.1 helix-turn-helix transcriptional regulator [Bradyrhizobium sp. CB3035]